MIVGQFGFFDGIFGCLFGIGIEVDLVVLVVIYYVDDCFVFGMCVGDNVFVCYVVELGQFVVVVVLGIVYYMCEGVVFDVIFFIVEVELVVEIEVGLSIVECVFVGKVCGIEVVE